MWKIIRRTFLALIAVALVAAIFSWRLKFLDLPLRLGLEKLTGQPVTLSSINFRLFNRITLENITVGKEFRARTVTAYINPWQIISDYRHPEKALIRVHFEQPWLSTDPFDRNSLIGRLMHSNGEAGGSVSAVISWERGSFAAGFLQLTEINGSVSLGGQGSGHVKALVNDRDRLALRFTTEKSGESTNGNLDASLTGPSIDVRTETAFTLTGSDMKLQTRFPVLRAGGMSLSGSTAAFVLSGKEYALNFESSAGTASVRGIAGRTLTAGGSIDLHRLSGSLWGKVSFTGKKDGTSVTSTVDIADSSLGDTPLGGARISLSSDDQGRLVGRGSMYPSGYLIDFSLKDSACALYLRSPDSGYAKLSGTLSPANLQLKVSRWPLSSLPYVSARFPGISGRVSADGHFMEKESRLSLTADEIAADGCTPLSFSGSVFTKAGSVFYHAESNDQSVTVSGRSIAGRKEWDISTGLSDFPTDLVSTLLLRTKIAGSLSGNVEYSNSGNGSAQLSFRDMKNGGLTVDEGRLNLSIAPDKIVLSDLTLRSGKGTATGTVNVGTGQHSNPCEANFRFARFPAGKALLSGELNALGVLNKNGTWQFDGHLKSSRFKINDLATRAFESVIAISPERFDLKDFAWSPYFKGDLSVNLNDRSLSAAVALKSFDLNLLSPELHGPLSGSLSLAGTIDQPRARLSYSAIGTAYQGYAISHKGTIIYENGQVSGDSIVISTGTNMARVSGTFWPSLAIRGEIERASADLCGSLLSTQLPLKGDLKGSFTVSGVSSAPLITAELNSNTLSYGRVPLSDFSTGVRYSNNVLSLDFLVAKFSDNELRLLPDSRLDLTNRKFDVACDLRNIQAGPFNLFGSIQASGSWENIPGSRPALRGNFLLKNFWINQHHLENFPLLVRYHEKGITFLPNGFAGAKLSGFIDTHDLERIRCQRVQLTSDNGMTITIDGEIGSAGWDIAASGKSVPVQAVSEILDAPDSEGTLDFNVIGKGSLERPQLEGSLNLSNGVVAGIPYDNINVQVSGRQDIVTIINARLIKKDGYTVVATGYAPFFLTAEGRERLSRNPMDLTLNIDQGSLRMLQGLSPDIRSASGALRAQLRVTGTMDKPLANGYIRVQNGEIEAKRYVDRLSAISIDALWKNNVVTFREFSAKAGNSLMKVAGSIVFDGLKPSAYDLSWFTEGNRGLPITIPELPIPTPLIKPDNIEFLSNFSRGEPRFMLQLKGPANNPLLAGWIELENTHFTYPSLVRKGSAGGGLLDDLWPKLNWDVELRAGHNCWYDNELASVNTEGSIQLSGKGAAPSASGHIEAIRGNIVYFGTEFKIDQASLEIVKDVVYLEAEAETTIYGSGTTGENDTIQMIIDKAEIGRIQPHFISKSNPDMTPEKAMAVATGINPDTYSSSDLSYFLRRSLIRFFDSTLTTPLAKNLLRRSGLVDSFRVQYMSQETPTKAADPANPTLVELLSGTKYSLEKYISDRVLLGYSMTLDQLENKLDLRHEIELSYNLHKNIFLKGVYEIETRNPFHQYDRRITLEQQWRFGWPQKKSRASKSNPSTSSHGK